MESNNTSANNNIEEFKQYEIEDWKCDKYDDDKIANFWEECYQIENEELLKKVKEAVKDDNNNK